MRKKKESDHSLTTSEEVAAVKTLDAAEEKPKVRSGVFGIIAIFSSLVLLLIAFINPFHTNGQYHLDANTDLTIKLKLTSEEFLYISTKNVCDGTGSVNGIKTSSAFAVGKGIDAKVQVGTGQLNDQGECEYVIKVPTTDAFKGGSVNFSFKFPFGKSREFPINVGDTAPYAAAIITIPLD